ncbi:biotin-dependent carboxyltransferase family protein [Ruania alkalisoli]|uniref:Biotin-dependent carboxyltransferase family protein n=1 Tax=Ruania alkalisoli TaxID=2779775 RepID=A0A7M1SQ86_9MICO|nr:biotin-dependent carboxyltransferase family protein [Ruania alkalisoli]QOR69601.1 biotin-dependent carboxyltransferase family protein [Ruania alkalisoli]
MLRVLDAGLVLIEDLGRAGHAASGVSASGAADRGALVAANRRLGNPDGAPALEVMLGQLHLRAEQEVLVTLAGAPAPLRADGMVHPPGAVVMLPAGAELMLRTPPWGLRSYLAVRGGIDVPRVLGSASHDVLSGLGPPPVQAGDVLSVGTPSGPVPTADVTHGAPHTPFLLDVLPGPRRDWFTPEAVETFLSEPYTVTDTGDRVGVRLDGPVLERARSGELASEGVVRGSVQVPPDGKPLIFGPDHPVTGGYPVIGVLTEAAADASAQVRPGQQVRFRHRGW